ncbi:MAG: proprotein convertase P-domain-containing protein, partial [Deltaproteobacteria bacterium]|nr:proprotein convertase P-domain-containing protein [Deltaproteobacteria bacterium]
DKKKSAGPTTPTLNFALDLPHSGSLDIGEISVFKITGISEGLPLLFTLTGMTDNADLRIYGDSGLTTMLCESIQAGTLDESCPVFSPGTSVYVEITDLSTAGNVFTLNGQFNGLVLSFGVDLPYPGMASEGEVQMMEIAGITPDAVYNFSLTGLSKNADMQLFYDEGFTSLICSSENPDAQDELCIVSTPGTSLFLRISNLDIGSVNYTLDVVVNPAPLAVFNYGVSSWIVSSTVNLDGSASFDPVGEAVTFDWTLAAPAGSSASLTDPTAPTLAFDADVHGVYSVTLAVSDGHQDGLYTRDIFIAPVPQHSSTSVPLAIPDLNPGSAIASLSVSGAPTSVSAVTVYVDISTTYAGDIILDLQSPMGTWVTLTQNFGSSSDNFVGTIFSDFGNTAISFGISPFTGVYVPVGSLSAFEGQDANGTWQLQVTDSYSGDFATLQNFSLHIE